jgi:hypothetical protein
VKGVRVRVGGNRGAQGVEAPASIQEGTVVLVLEGASLGEGRGGERGEEWRRPGLCLPPIRVSVRELRVRELRVRVRVRVRVSLCLVVGRVAIIFSECR